MQIGIDELRAIPTPVATKTWNPIPHHEIFDRVEHHIKKSVNILETRIDADKTGNNVFVTHKLDFSISEKTDKYPQLGWRNSINKKLSLGFTSGMQIIVCSNLVFSGSWIEFKKHTSSLDMLTVDVMATQGIQHALQESVKSYSFHDQMMEQKRDKHHADHLFMEMLRTGVVSSRQILDLSNAYDEEKARYGENLYTIYNCATQTFRELTLPTISERSSLLNNLINSDIEASTIDVAAIEETVH